MPGASARFFYHPHSGMVFIGMVYLVRHPWPRLTRGQYRNMAVVCLLDLLSQVQCLQYYQKQTNCLFFVVVGKHVFFPTTVQDLLPGLFMAGLSPLVPVLLQKKTPFRFFLGYFARRPYIICSICVNSSSFTISFTLPECHG